MFQLRTRGCQRFALDLLVAHVYMTGGVSDSSYARGAACVSRQKRSHLTHGAYNGCRAAHRVPRAVDAT